MAGSVNKVILVGNLGRDPEIRSFPNGGRVANLSIATSESWKDKNTGERKEKSEWHKVAVMNDALVGIVERFLKKGSKVYIEGKLETRKYQKDGHDVYTTEIVLRPYGGELTILDSRKEDNGTHKGFNRDGDVPSGRDDMDDEIPFMRLTESDVFF